MLASLDSDACADVSWSTGGFCVGSGGAVAGAAEGGAVAGAAEGGAVAGAAEGGAVAGAAEGASDGALPALESSPALSAPGTAPRALADKKMPTVPIASGSPIHLCRIELDAVYSHMAGEVAESRLSAISASLHRPIFRRGTSAFDPYRSLPGGGGCAPTPLPAYSPPALSRFAWWSRP
jgi:hypothetical protein